MRKLDELQIEFMERHKDADMIECWLAPPKGNGKVKFAVYYSPEWKALEHAREFFRAVVEEEQKGLDTASTVGAAGMETMMSDQVAWLIERNGLCLGFRDRKWKWVTFTDISAFRLARRSDAVRFIETMRGELQLEDVLITEHLWS